MNPSIIYDISTVLSHEYGKINNNSRIHLCIYNRYCKFYRSSIFITKMRTNCNVHELCISFGVELSAHSSKGQKII